jgi:multidrug resistance efflux pump
MRALRKRPRSDNLANQQRRQGGNFGRRVYLILLGVFALSIANYLWGDFLMLRGNGLVLRDKNVVARSYVSRIAAVNVEAGQAVKRGDVLLRIESVELLERLAELSTRQADLTQKAAEFHLRSQVAKQMLPLAVRREKKTGQVLAQFDSMTKRGLLTSTSYEQALKANFDAGQDRVRLTAEQDTLRTQIKALEDARADATAALKNLQEHYANGVVRAVNDGSVGARVPSVGDVYRSGDPMLSIYTGEAYVLTYLPARYLFSIQPGMKVVVSSGRHSDEGVVTEILPVSDALPSEFQNTFKPRERNQLARIKLSAPHKFPIFEKVEISRKYYY